jgi:aryl-alcohol dehydrogenase-like predicted oxidoreductase
VARLESIAREHRCSPAQLALAWLLSQGPDVVPIPGTKQRAKLEENVAAVALNLSAADRSRIAAAFPRGAAAGERYAERALAAVDG